MYEVYKLPIIDKRINESFTKIEIIQLKKFIDKLKINPYIGKPIKYDFLREAKFREKRVYFLIYNEICLVLVIGESDKKSQQQTINNIIKNLKLYKKLAYELYRD